MPISTAAYWYGVDLKRDLLLQEISEGAAFTGLVIGGLKE